MSERFTKPEKHFHRLSSNVVQCEAGGDDPLHTNDRIVCDPLSGAGTCRTLWTPDATILYKLTFAAPSITVSDAVRGTSHPYPYGAIVDHVLFRAEWFHGAGLGDIELEFPLVYDQQATGCIETVRVDLSDSENIVYGGVTDPTVPPPYTSTSPPTVNPITGVRYRVGSYHALTWQEILAGFVTFTITGGRIDVVFDATQTMSDMRQTVIIDYTTDTSAPYSYVPTLTQWRIGGDTFNPFDLTAPGASPSLRVQAEWHLTHTPPEFQVNRTPVVFSVPVTSRKATSSGWGFSITSFVLRLDAGRGFDPDVANGPFTYTTAPGVVVNTGTCTRDEA